MPIMHFGWYSFVYPFPCSQVIKAFNASQRRKIHPLQTAFLVSALVRATLFKPAQNSFQFQLLLFYITAHLPVIGRENAGVGGIHLSNTAFIFANRLGENGPCVAIGLTEV